MAHLREEGSYLVGRHSESEFLKYDLVVKQGRRAAVDIPANVPVRGLVVYRRRVCRALQAMATTFWSLVLSLPLNPRLRYFWLN